MSIDNKNIDQMFSDAAHSQKAPQYDSAYWAEMNAMLNAKDAKKRGFILWALGGSALFAALFLSLFILNMDFTPTQERIAKTSSYDEFISDKTETRNTTITDQNKSVEKDVSAATEIESKETGKHTKESYVETNRSNNINEKDNKENFTLKAQSNVSSTDDLDRNVQSNNQDVLSKTSNIDERNANNNEQIEHLNDLVKDNQLNDNTERSEEISTLPFEQKNMLSQDDAGNLFESKVKYRPTPNFVLYAKIGGGLMENYKTSRPYESGLADLSMNIEMKLNNILLKSGIGVQHTSSADLILSQTAKVYGFGLTRHQNDLSYQSLFDVYIPLEFGYRINATSFGIGVQANYLLTTGMDLNHYENNNLVGTEKYFGSSNGLNKFSTQGYLWMEHQLTNRLSLGVKVGTNISGRIKDDSYFNQSSTTNPIYGQFTLRFNILQ
ncbi:MAG TPA: hypothetical protein VKY37_12510 [Brumimicrobium sp.]|nr:hypothetical protein [Brumimicrobium sp.]